MDYKFKTTSNYSINTQVVFIFNKILPIILILVLIYFVFGLRVNRSDNNESWINYINIPYGQISTGSDNPLNYYKITEYRKPYRWPLGINQSYPINHIAPL